MRIRGVVSDEDEDGDTVLEPAKLGKIIENVTAKYTEDGQGVNILASPDEFKSTYQILLELSKVWDKLTDTESAYLLEKIAGKHRATVLQSILSNEETLIKSYETALNSAGSAMEEFEKRTESIEYHLNQLNAAWQELSTNAASIEFITGIIDAGRYLVEFVDKIGALTTVFGLFGAAAGTYTKVSIVPALDAKFEQTKLEAGAAGEKVKAFGKEIDVTSNSISSVDKKLVGLSKTLKGLGKIIGGGIIGAVVLTGLSIAFEKISEFVDNAKHEVSNLSGEIDSLTASITSMKSEIDSLNSDGLPTQGELQRIKILKKQIELEENLLRLKNEQKADAILKNSEAYFSGNRTGAITSEFEDAMKKAEKASKAYKENIDFLEENADAVINADEYFALYASNSLKYGRMTSELNYLIHEYNEAQSQTATLYEDASNALKDLYQQQDTLNWVLDNGTASQKEAAKVQKTNLDLFVYELEMLLGIADSYENASAKVEKYNAKHKKLSSVVKNANENSKITISEFETLKEEYPEVAEEVGKYASKTEDAYILEEEAIDALNDALNESRKIQLQAQCDMTQAAIIESNKRIKKYQEEASGILKILEATLLVSDKLAETEIIGISPLLLETEDMSLYGPYEYDGSGRTLYDNVVKNLSTEEQQILKAIKAEQESIKRAKLDLELLQKEINSIGLKTLDGKDPDLGGNGTGDAADVFDQYTNALARVNEELERYGNAVEVVQAQLDLNQSQEERTVDLLSEEQRLYSELLAAQEAQYQIVNDTLWLQMQQLKAVQQQAQAKIADINPDIDTSNIENWTKSDIDYLLEYQLKLDDSEASQDLENFLYNMVEMGGSVHDLHMQWYDLKEQRQQTILDSIQAEIDVQNDVLDQYDDARKNLDTILDLLGEVENTEDRRKEIIHNLTDSYEKQKDTIDAMYQANINKMAEYAKDMDKYGQAYALLEEQNAQLEEDKLAAIEAQFDYKKQLLELEKEQAEAQAEYKIYGDEGQDKWEKHRQKEIDALQEQLEALDKENEEDAYAEQMAEYEEQLAEKEEELAELYTKLDNLRSQKTVQTLKEQADGSFQWEYVTDQIAINEALEEVSDKQNEIEELRNDIKEAQDEHALEMEKQVIEDKIAAIEDEVTRRQELYDEQLSNIQETYNREMQILGRWLQDEIAHWQNTILVAQQNLETYKNVNVVGWQAATEATEEELTKLDKAYNTHFGNIVTTIKGYAEQAIHWINEIRDAEIEAARAVADAKREAAEAASSDGSHANGLKFVESNNYIARLHYGERVLTRQEAREYNELESDIKSGRLAAYFESAQIDTANAISTAVSSSVRSVSGSAVPTAASTSTSFVIEHLELPNVQDAKDFANVLQSWARNEFGGLAQKAKIVKAR